MHDSMCYPHFTCPLQLGNKQLRLSVAVCRSRVRAAGERGSGKGRGRERGRGCVTREQPRWEPGSPPGDLSALRVSIFPLLL